MCEYQCESESESESEEKKQSAMIALTLTLTLFLAAGSDEPLARRSQISNFALLRDLPEVINFL